MTMLWLPQAIRDPHPRAFPWQETTDPKGCLHTTEGSGWPTYNGWTVHPHGTVMPVAKVGVIVRQHLALDQASFSLRHTRPQPTGGDYVFQWELVGTCDPNGPPGAYYWPEADDAVLLDLYLKVVRPLDSAYVIPFRALPFLRYPDRAGTNRLSDAMFDVYSGWLGHQHVPQNDHGDPGAFPWSRMAALAARYEESLTMPTPREIADAVWSHPLGSAWDGSTDQTAEQALTSAQRYAIEAGYPGQRPAGNGRPGTPTWADQVEAQLADQAAALARIEAALAKPAPTA